MKYKAMVTMTTATMITTKPPTTDPTITPTSIQTSMQNKQQLYATTIPVLSLFASAS